MTLGTGNLKNSGFTLIEVVVASAILVTGLIMVAGVFGRHLSALQFIQRSGHAFRLAEQEMVQALLRRELGASVEGAGSEDQMEWTVGLEALEPPPEGVNQVHSSVLWSHRGQSRTTQLSSGLAEIVE